MATTWTKPFHGVQHTAKLATGHWCTVEDHGTFTRLSMWKPGCGFSPEQRTFDTPAEARAAGEAWLNLYR